MVPLSKEDIIGMYTKMLTVRRFEERIAAEYERGRIRASSIPP